MVTDIGTRRELFLDEALLDMAQTTAKEVLHHPTRREQIMTNDAPWEADGWVYYTVLEDAGRFRMYYLSMPMFNRDHTKHDPPFHHINYAESTDGICWEKPCLGICEYEGSYQNNILVKTDTMDAFHVFLDGNPLCPADQRYKAVYTKPNSKLWCMASADGIHFEDGWQITDKGRFDSHNTAFWDQAQGMYVCYFRDFHDADGTAVRDIRVIESKDFHTWTEPKQLCYEGMTDDFHMYTNGIAPYFRAPHMYIGFPTRYTDRYEWTNNYARLCGAPRRQMRMGFHPRYGLALTDGLIMSSRNGKVFKRRDEAFLRPGPESLKRWVYGDGYAGYGLLATNSQVAGEDKELSLYASVNHWSDEPVQVFRYTLRMDGFVSRSSGWIPQTVVTRPFTFAGSVLSVNFSTSAAGSVRIVMTDKNGVALPGYDSGELFGDCTDRIVDFPDPLAVLNGKPVCLRFLLQDADIYSFQFQAEDGV